MRLQGKLACKWDRKVKNCFAAIGFPPVLTASFGLLPLLGLSGVAFSSVLSSTAFVKALRAFYCPACVNFSCPLNTVPKAAVDS